MLTCRFEDGNEASLRHITVGVILLNDKKEILLTRRAIKLLEGGKLSLPGGYMARDETLEECGKRETLEETGCESKDYKLLCIIDDPNRPKEDRQNVSFIFFAKVGEKVGEKDHEVLDYKWYKLDDLPLAEEFAFDHYENIQLYLQYLKTRFPLPVIKHIYSD